jgi:predicted enzyme related to lactoylglutathione lyase
LQIALNVDDLNRSIDFYSQLFNTVLADSETFGTGPDEGACC